MSAARAFLVAALMAAWMSPRLGLHTTWGTASCRLMLKKGRSRKKTPPAWDPPRRLRSAARLRLVAASTDCDSRCSFRTQHHAWALMHRICKDLSTVAAAGATW